MKHMKKLASLLLALTLVFALAATAFADGTNGSITVDNPRADQTYTAYKIFDVVYNDEGTAYSYTIDSGSEWYSTVQAYATEANGLTLTQVNGSTTYNVTTTGTFSAPNFAVALKTAVSGKTGTALTAQDNGTVSVSNLPLGYYFVTSTNGALCNLTTTNPSVMIHDKNDMPFFKDDDQESVDVGQTVNYTITGKVPDYTGFADYTYLITDTMSSGLTFKKDVKSYTIGAEIKVTYSAVVNENAVAKIENNSATLTYSNNPSNSSETAKTPEYKETVYSAKIVIDKYETGKENTKLAGATFVLYKEVTTEGTTKMYYMWNDTAKKVDWVADKTQATPKTTEDTGAASFDGLADGTYYLEETAAPAGYNMLPAPVSVIVNGASATTADLSALTVTQEVANSTGTELPSTGGMGTTIFYILGGILAVTAVVLLVTKKRMNSAE